MLGHQMCVQSFPTSDLEEKKEKHRDSDHWPLVSVEDCSLSLDVH